MWIVTQFILKVGGVGTGLSPTITIYDLSDDSVVINGAATSEIGATGSYKYNFAGYDKDKDYLIVWDAGVDTVTDRYPYAGNESFLDDIADTVWDEDLSTHTTNGSAAHYMHDIHYMDIAVYVNEDALVNGDGSNGNPYDNIGDAIDYAEAEGLRKIVVLSDITLDRNLKNFEIYGTGVPAVDCNDQDLTESVFNKCSLSGGYTGSIVAQECVLADGVSLVGYFENCAISGTASASTTTPTLVKNCTSLTHDASISLNGGVASNVIVTQYEGDLTIKNAINANDHIDIVMTGHLTIDSTCTAGGIHIWGNVVVTDNSNGATVSDYSSKSEIELIKKILKNRLVIDSANSRLIIYDDNGSTPLLTYDLTDYEDNSIASIAGYPAKRSAPL